MAFGSAFGHNMAFSLAFGHNMAFGPAFGHNMAFGLAFGHNTAFGLAFGPDMAFGSAFGHNMAFGLAFGHNAAFNPAFGHNKLLVTAFGHIKLFKLSELIVKYPILIVRINGLDRHTGPKGLIGLFGCCIGLIDLLAQAPSNIQVYCCVDFVALIIIPNFEEAQATPANSMLIVGYHYTKISLPFCKDCRIFL
jgi:hypothetical protein